MQVVFRLDTSFEIGTGHLARCRVLADALHSERAAMCIFIGRDPDGMLADGLKDSPHTFHVLPEPERTVPSLSGLQHAHWLGRSQAEDIELCKQLLAEAWFETDWVVVDHYGIDAEWECQLSAYVLAVDDLADRKHVADILVDQNLRSDEGSIYRQFAPTARLAAGPANALLREEFVHSRERQFTAAARRLFVCFGGVDAMNLTAATVRALGDERIKHIPADIVVGSAYRLKDELHREVETLAACKLHVGPANVAELMAAADIGIGAAGCMTWERCAMGLPSLAVAVAENQQPLLAGAERAGAVQALDLEQAQNPRVLADRILALSENQALRQRMSRSARSLCDGRGVRRIMQLMKDVETGRTQ